jgi:hypothetical protein
MPRKSRAKFTAEPETVDPAPPEKIILTGERRELFESVSAKYKLSDADTALLVQACECSERAAQLAAIVSRDGAIFVDRFGQPRKSASAELEHSFRALAGRLLAQLAARMDAV